MNTSLYLKRSLHLPVLPLPFYTLNPTTFYSLLCLTLPYLTRSPISFSSSPPLSSLPLSPPTLNPAAPTSLLFFTLHTYKNMRTSVYISNTLSSSPCSCSLLLHAQFSFILTLPYLYKNMRTSVYISNTLSFSPRSCSFLPTHSCRSQLSLSSLSLPTLSLTSQALPYPCPVPLCSLITRPFRLSTATLTACSPLFSPSQFPRPAWRSWATRQTPSSTSRQATRSRWSVL